MSDRILSGAARERLRKAHTALLLAAKDIETVLRGPGRPPKDASPLPTPKPITLERVRMWLKPSFSSILGEELAKEATAGQTKICVCMLLCQRGPYINKEIQRVLLTDYAIRLTEMEVSRCVVALRTEGLITERNGHGNGWSNYWQWHEANVKNPMTGEWDAEPVRWKVPENEGRTKVSGN